MESLARLRNEGLWRHDAVHAIGSVLAEHMFNVLIDASSAASPEVYYDRVRRLSAAEWLRSGPSS